jgi:hypothetical protein
MGSFAKKKSVGATSRFFAASSLGARKKSFAGTKAAVIALKTPVTETAAQGDSTAGHAGDDGSRKVSKLKLFKVKHGQAVSSKSVSAAVDKQLSAMAEELDSSTTEAIGDDV